MRTECVARGVPRLYGCGPPTLVCPRYTPLLLWVGRGHFGGAINGAISQHTHSPRDVLARSPHVWTSRHGTKLSSRTSPKLQGRSIRVQRREEALTNSKSMRRLVPCRLSPSMAPRRPAATQPKIVAAIAPLQEAQARAHHSRVGDRVLRATRTARGRR